MAGMRVGSRLLVLVAALCIVKGQGQKTFNNPIFDGDSPDPSIFRHGDDYYLVVTRNGDSELTVYKSRELYNFRNVESKVAYKTQGDEASIWASEMHIVNSHLYLYFGMAGRGTNHRIYAMKAENGTNPMGNWGRPIRIMPEYNRGTNDLSILQHGNGKRYFMWSDGYNNQGLALWIAPMLDALRVGEPKVNLRYAMADWETQGGPLNAGPSFLYRNGISYLIFSASNTFGADFCLGMMSIPADRDPMVPENWWFGKDEPVFWRNDAEGVYAVGHASFTTSPGITTSPPMKIRRAQMRKQSGSVSQCTPSHDIYFRAYQDDRERFFSIWADMSFADGTETWMIYHGSDRDNNIGGNRVSRADKIDWDANGVPVFPRPSGYNKAQATPSEGRSPPTPQPPPTAPGPAVKNEESDGLSGGAIAGIVIGVLLGVALIAGVGYYFTMIRNRRPAQGSAGGATTSVSFGNPNHDASRTNSHVAASLRTHASDSYT